MPKNPHQEGEELVAHGATGAVVGTTNTQTLTNKTLTAPVIGDFTNASHPNSAHSSIVTVVKSADETVNNSVTLQNDDELLFAVLANEVWICQIILKISSGATPDFQLAITVPTNTTQRWRIHHEDVSGVLRWTEFYQASSPVSLREATSYGVAAILEGIIAVGNTAGNVQLQWAQNTLDASDTTVKQHSVLIATKVA